MEGCLCGDGRSREPALFSPEPPSEAEGEAEGSIRPRSIGPQRLSKQCTLHQAPAKSPEHPTAPPNTEKTAKQNHKR
jgi:hypothetical protein